MNQDWIHDRDRLIEIEMSPSQFADLITIHNTNGHPVTLTYFNGKDMPKCPFNDSRAEIEEEFKEKCRDIASDASKIVARARELIKGPLKVAEKKELLDALMMLEQEIKSNLPFVQSQFNEAIDSTTSAAKQEVEAFFASKLQSLGLSHLKEAIEKSIPVVPEIEKKP